MNIEVYKQNNNNIEKITYQNFSNDVNYKQFLEKHSGKATFTRQISNQISFEQTENNGQIQTTITINGENAENVGLLVMTLDENNQIEITKY